MQCQNCKVYMTHSINVTTGCPSAHLVSVLFMCSRCIMPSPLSAKSRAAWLSPCADRQRAFRPGWFTGTVWGCPLESTIHRLPSLTPMMVTGPATRSISLLFKTALITCLIEPQNIRHPPRKHEPLLVHVIQGGDPYCLLTSQLWAVWMYTAIQSGFSHFDCNFLSNSSSQSLLPIIMTGAAHA